MSQETAQGRKPKIMMVCEAFGGGVYAYVRQLCNDMVDDFDVTLVCSVRPQTPKGYRDDIDSRVNLIELDEMSKLTPLGIRKSVKDLRKLENKLNPDIIHLHSSIAGGLGRLAFDGSDGPVVYTPHGYAHVLMGPEPKASLYLAMEKYLGKKDCITLTCCESEDEEARKLCKRTAYIETGVNLAELSKELDGIEPAYRDRFTVFTLGRTSKQKRPDLFNRIAELVPEADFLWIGGGELESQLTAPTSRSPAGSRATRRCRWPRVPTPSCCAPTARRSPWASSRTCTSRSSC